MSIMRRSILCALLTVATPSFLMAATGALCSADEETIFSCNTKRKMFEICASKDLSATSGYMQYRAGSRGKVEFVYPRQREAPAGMFHFSLLPRGAKFSFQNGNFSYEIVEPLIGKPQIWVSQSNGAVIQVVECLNFTESLTLTTTQNRFKNLGIYE